MRADKLLIIRSANVDKRPDGRGAIGGIEWRIVDGIAVDFSNIKILLDFCDVVGFDSVGYTPYLVGSRIVVIGELFPVRPFDESNYSSGSFWSPSMVLTNVAFGLALETSPLDTITLARGVWVLSYLAYFMVNYEQH